MIIVDDGSTDCTSWVVEYFRKKDKRIKYYRRGENEGIGFTRNEAISKASGEWIVTLDSDDVCYNNRLEIINKAMEQFPKADLFYTDIDWGSTNAAGVMETWIAKPVTEEELKKGNQCLTHGTMVANKSVFNKVPYNPDKRMNDDMDFTIRAFKEGLKMQPVRERTVIYRINPSSTSKINYDDIQKDTKKMVKEML